MSGRYTLSDVRETYKKRDAWWTVLLVDPLAGRLTVPIANHTSLTPNQLTVGAAFLGLGAAGAFLDGSRAGLLIGAVLFYLSFVIDCIDGKIARLKLNGTVFGTWLDYVLDRVKVAACAVALMTGQYVRTDRAIYLYLALIVLIMEMVRYLDLARVRDTRRMMNSRIRAAVRRIAAANGETAQDAHGPSGLTGAALRGTAATAATAETSDTVGAEDDPRSDESEDAALDDLLARYRDPAVVLHEDFRRRFGFYERFRAFLLRHRIRTHLWSGIEFEMFVFIIGPLTGAILPVTVASAALLLVFEGAVIYKLWLSTKDYARVMQELEALASSSAESTEPSVGLPGSGRRMGDVRRGSLPSQSHLSSSIRAPASRPDHAAFPAPVAGRSAPPNHQW